MNREQAEQFLKHHRNSQVRIHEGWVYTYNSFWDRYYMFGRDLLPVAVNTLPETQYEVSRTLPSLPEYATWKCSPHQALVVDDTITEEKYPAITTADGRMVVEHKLHILQALLDEYDGRL